jgi:hypothetical protein
MINIDLNSIKKWEDTWLVKFNPNKTEIMIFNIRNQQDELSFDFDGIVLNSLTCPQLSHTSDEYSKIGLMKVK